MVRRNGVTDALALTVAEAAKILGRHERMVYRAVERGELSSRRLAGRICIARRDLEGWAGGDPFPITAAEVAAAVAGLDAAITAAQQVRAGLTDMVARLERREGS